MEIAYVVKPLSARDIEIDSVRFLMSYHDKFLLGKERSLDVERAADSIFMDKNFTLQLVGDHDLPKEVLACTEMDSCIIKVRESDYNKCDYDGMSRMNIMHEIGHARLQSDQIHATGILYSVVGNTIPAYKNSEWQAKVWGSATLMPYPRMIKIIDRMKGASERRIINEICEEFKVTEPAAKVRFETIQKYRADGRATGIEATLKQWNLI